MDLTSANAYSDLRLRMAAHYSQVPPPAMSEEAESPRRVLMPALSVLQQVTARAEDHGCPWRSACWPTSCASTKKDSCCHRGGGCVAGGGFCSSQRSAPIIITTTTLSTAAASTASESAGLAWMDVPLGPSCRASSA